MTILCSVLSSMRKKRNLKNDRRFVVMEIGRDTVKGAGFRLVPAPAPLVLNAVIDFPVNPQKLCLE